MSVHRFTRRDAFAGLGALVGNASGAGRQDDTATRRPRLVPRDELVNLLEFEEMARVTLPDAAYAAIAGSNREAFDRMSLRPRVFVRSSTLDLTTELFGERMFAPILVAPISEQQRFHPDGELATVQGASEASTTMLLSSQSSHPVERIARQAETTLWYQVDANAERGTVRTQIHQAVDAGCKAVCIDVGARPSDQFPPSGAAGPDWRMVDALREGLDVPLLLKGIMKPEDARGAMENGLSGVVVSSGGVARDDPSPVEMLAPVVDAVEGQIPVLIDGSFRRGTDVIKALALGATAVLLGRPPMWGLAAYGAQGVRAVLTMLQTELARTMINVGKPTMDMLGRDLVKIHSRASH